TVYRNLEVLQELGLVRHTHLSDRAPTYHRIGDHEHFHLVCRACGRVTSVGPEVLGDVVDRLRREHGFVPDVGHLAVHGTCVTCEHGSRDDTGGHAQVHGAGHVPGEGPSD